MGALGNQLRANGVEAWIDRYVQDPEEGWISWMRSQVEQANKALLGRAKGVASIQKTKETIFCWSDNLERTFFSGGVKTLTLLERRCAVRPR